MDIIFTLLWGNVINKPISSSFLQVKMKVCILESDAVLGQQGLYPRLPAQLHQPETKAKVKNNCFSSQPSRTLTKQARRQCLGGMRSAQLLGGLLGKIFSELVGRESRNLLGCSVPPMKAERDYLPGKEKEKFRIHILLTCYVQLQELFCPSKLLTALGTSLAVKGPQLVSQTHAVVQQAERGAGCWLSATQRDLEQINIFPAAFPHP